MAHTDIRITVSAITDRPEWDDYVSAHKDGSLFNLSGWCEIARAVYGYQPVYITARRGGALVGVLPLVDVRSPLLGRALVSTGFTVGGGPLADDRDTHNALLANAEIAGRARRARYVECRSAQFSPQALMPGWAVKNETHAQFRLTIRPDDETQLKAVPRKRRADIRKALQAEDQGAFSIRYDNDIDTFYKLYARALRCHGTPVFPKRFLDALIKEFRSRIEIATADYEGAAAASLLTFYDRDAALPYYIGTGPNGRASRAHDYIYWSVMRRAAELGYKTFNFGRSRIGAGAHAYKKSWGADEMPVRYTVKLLVAQRAPNVSPDNPAFSVFSKAWPRLPQFAANRLGPLLAPNFP